MNWFKRLFKKQAEAYRKRNRELLKHFKVEIEVTTWGRKTRIIQRDIPLTDEQVNELEKVPNP